MSINSRKVLYLLKNKLNSMSLLDSDFTEMSSIDKNLCDNVLNLIDTLDNQENLMFTSEDELIDQDITDENFVYQPVYENLEIVNDSFSFDYICKVLDYKEKNPNHSFNTIQHMFRRVKSRSYLQNFKAYRDNLGTSREKYVSIAKYCHDKFVQTRESGVVIHDRTIRSWAITKARQLNLFSFTASNCKKFLYLIVLIFLINYFKT